MAVEPHSPWYMQFPVDTALGRVDVLANPNHFGWDVFIDGVHVCLLRGSDVAMCRSETEIIELVAKIVRTGKMSVYEQLAEIG